MANKYFLAVCCSKKTKHPQGDVSHKFAICAGTQTDARRQAGILLSGADAEHGNLEFYMQPKLSLITEEEFLERNAEIIEEELEPVVAEVEDVDLNEFGFYDGDGDSVITARREIGDDFAEIKLLNYAPGLWCFGTRYKFGTSDHHKQITPANGEFEEILDCFNEAMNVLYDIAAFYETNGSDEAQDFALVICEHDFAEDIFPSPEDDPEVEIPELYQAVKFRLQDDPDRVPIEVYSHLESIINAHTNNLDLQGLCEYIETIKNPANLTNSANSVNVVMKFERPEEKPEAQDDLSIAGGDGIPEAQPDVSTEVSGDDEPEPEQREIPPFHEWSKANNWATFDDYAEEFDIDFEDGPPMEAFEDDRKTPENRTEAQIDRPIGSGNLDVWDAAFQTDVKYTKPDTYSGRTSINAQFRQKQATRLFGPRGKGWGVDVIREWETDGAPIFINGQFSNFFEKIHNMEIKLWYIHPDDGVRYEITAYGDTPKIYYSWQNQRFVSDNECIKKSLTDATGKALSMLGICGDVYMGEFDDAVILSKVERAAYADKQVAHLEADAKIGEEVLTKVKSYTDKMATAPSLAEIKRLQKVAKAQLEGFPTSDDEMKRKRDEAIKRVDKLADEALTAFKQDLEGAASG